MAMSTHFSYARSYSVLTELGPSFHRSIEAEAVVGAEPAVAMGGDDGGGHSSTWAEWAYTGGKTCFHRRTSAAWRRSPRS